MVFSALLSSASTPFLQNIVGFPTVFFTIALGICLAYWLIAAAGMVDIDLFGIDGLDTDMEASSGVFAGLLLRFGLTGVPLTISITIVCLVGWALCYYAMLIVSGFIDSSLSRYVIGVPVFYVSLYLAARITGFLIRPLRKLFSSATQQTKRNLNGQVATVRTSVVDNDFGEVVLEDGGAGLILKARSIGEDRFSRGDQVVLFKKRTNTDVWQVMSEYDFTGQTEASKNQNLSKELQ